MCCWDLTIPSLFFESLFEMRRSPLSVCVCVQSVKTTDFVAKTTFFVVKMTDFWRRWRIFYFFFVFAKNPSSSPMFTLHTNEWSTYTEHVQTYLWGNPLYWACAHAALGMCRHNNEGKSTDWHDWQYWRRIHKLTVFTHSFEILLQGDLLVNIWIFH